MSTEGLPEEVGIDLSSLVVPDNIAGAVRIERSQRKKDFKNLHRQLERVDSYCVNRANFRQSYHTIPFSGGILRVLFRNTVVERFGPSFRIMVNTETTLPDDGRRMDIDDYIVARGADVIASDRSWLERGHHEFTWSGIMDGHGPIVGLKGATPTMYVGDSYAEPILTTSVNKFEEVLWRRDDARDLTSVLERLGGVSCEHITD